MNKVSPQHIIEYLQENTAITLKNVEEEANITIGLLGRVLRGERVLKDIHIEQLVPVLMKYGFKEHQIKKKARTISLVNHKGGVGKTTSTLNLGKGLSNEGKKVLIVDMDAQANLSQSLKVEQPEESVYSVFCNKAKLPIVEISENFHLVPSDIDLGKAELELQSAVNGYFRLKKALKEVETNYDYILIDCPPSLGILTINSLMASTDVIVCVQSEFLALKGLNTVLEMIDDMQEDLHPDLNLLGMLLTMTNRTIIKQNIIESIKDAHLKKVFDTTIRQNIAVVEASSLGMDIFSYNESCAAAQDYKELVQEILKR